MRPINDETLIGYLLSDLSEEERDRVESRYFTDEAMHQRLLLIEDQLVDAYVGGGLTPKRVVLFETRFLNSPERCEKVVFARSLAAYAAEADPARHAASAPVSRREWFMSLFRIPGPAARVTFVTAAAVLAVVSVVVVHNARHRTQSQSQIAVKTGDRKALPKETPKADQLRPGPAAKPLLAFVLAPMTRSGDVPNTLAIPQGVTQVRLQLPLEGETYGSYRARLSSAEGSLIFDASNLKAASAGPGGNSLFVTVPAVLLQRGDYVVTLLGIAPDESSEPVGGYAFRAEKAQ